MVKLHVDIIEDFILILLGRSGISENNGIFILEDRKFADIGRIFQKQFVEESIVFIPGVISLLCTL